MSESPFCRPAGMSVRSCKISDLCDCFDWPEYDLSSAACASCGRDPAEGYATIGRVRYCHGDGPRPTCYMRAVQAQSVAAFRAVVGEQQTGPGAS